MSVLYVKFYVENIPNSCTCIWGVAMLLAVYPNSLTCYVSYLHFLKTGFAILHTVTIERFLQNGDKILNFPLFSILVDLKMNKFV